MNNKSSFKALVPVLFFLGICGLLLSSPAYSLDPKSQIKATVDEILDILNNQDLCRPESAAAKREKILAIVKRRFDFQEMSRRTLTRHWKKMTTEEQAEFVRLFSKLLENTYSGRVESCSDNEVHFKKQLIEKKYAKVYSIAIQNNREIPINYKMLNKSGEWMVYDVIIEGVSLIRNYRTQFDEILKKENYAGLVKRMEEKIAQNEAADK